jgi:glyoxylate/hydroxypyruvate reductase A
MMGFDVAAWSRTRKEAEGVRTFAGEELDAFLARTDILVSLLPLTPDTRGILNGDLFQKLARDGRLGGPVLINAGRGGLQVEADILACLDDGTLKAATLDVFEKEPLPQDSGLWTHPNVTVTPHNSATSEPAMTARYIAEQILAIEAGEKPRALVDKTRGY